MARSRASCSTRGTGDVRSESPAAAGGQQNPGVFLSEAVDVIAEAGAAPLVYSAAALSVTTDGGTERVTDTVTAPVAGQLRTAPSAFDAQPRQADNDLGAGRSDGEDFLAYSWTVDGQVVAGNESGTRLDRSVETGSPGGKAFVNADVDRTVDDVNITRTLAQSGLKNTTDTVDFTVAVTESITGLSDTDTVQASYANAGPAATAGAGIEFDASNFTAAVQAEGTADDPDLAANAEVAGFETLTAHMEINGVPVTAGQNLGSPAAGPIAVSQGITLADAFDGGLTMTTGTATVDLIVTDFAGESASASQMIRYVNSLPTIANAGHAAGAGASITFNVDYDDPDLAVNPFLGVADFEVLFVEILVDGSDETAFFSDLIGTGGQSQFVDNATLIAMFGLGLHDFTLNVTDKQMRADGLLPITSTFQFEVTVVPLPAPLGLLAGAIALLGLRRYRTPDRIPASGTP